MTPGGAEGRHHKLAVLSGDGIGPEITEGALEVLRAVEARQDAFSLELGYEPGGAGHYLETGRNLDPETLERFASHYDGVLKGPTGLPDVRRPDGTEAGLLGGVLRGGLDTYANVRPIRLLPRVPSPVTHDPRDIDYVIVRENTEGLYASRGKGLANDWAATDTMLLTRPGVERIAEFAFALSMQRDGAPRDGIRRVTCVDKSNVLKSFVFFRGIVEEVAAAHPSVELDFLYADAAAQALVSEPARFDVIVTENFVGDILSDLGGGTIGGVGMCPSGNIGARAAYFEPAHGSAPSIAGRDLANPIAQVLSAAMLLDHLGESQAAGEIERAVQRACESGALTLTAMGTVEQGTAGAVAAIIDCLDAG